MEQPDTQTQKIVEYLRKNIKKGYKVEGLYYALMKQGYSRTSINHAITILKKQSNSETEKNKEKPNITYENYLELKKEDIKPEKKSFFRRIFKK